MQPIMEELRKISKRKKKKVMLTSDRRGRETERTRMRERKMTMIGEEVISRAGSKTENVDGRGKPSWKAATFNFRRAENCIIWCGPLQKRFGTIRSIGDFLGWQFFDRRQKRKKISIPEDDPNSKIAETAELPEVATCNPLTVYVCDDYCAQKNNATFYSSAEHSF
ncbi:hypothetical protein CEXT_408201 [Caerostris extrusa]|uniref:Uncharacterized protein n=1 Tax=Caerostris extrusa TaxID=172846 RepID=A0AAV4NIR3_CAEEX|nr:hypothetical protein CEXT_408201 [Caerostris extrusa]